MRIQDLSLLQWPRAGSFGNRGRLIALAGVLLLYPLFISGLSTNPGGFYYDEACQAYNGYLVATTGTAQNGASFPLFFQCYTEGFTQWMSPLYIYLLAGVYLFIPPSALSAHIVSATLVFIAIVLLGVLAARISGRYLIGVIVALTVMTTPWLFEVSRLAHEPTALSLGIVLFLFCLYNAYRREKWTLSDNFRLSFSLAMMTYAYAAGRVLGPAFALGLLIFAVNRRALFDVFKTWAIYFVLLIPFVAAYLTNRDALTARFQEVSYIAPELSWWAIVKIFVPAFFQDISPKFLLLDGDYILRHHIPGMGGIFAATFVLALLGLVIVLLRHRRDTWWRFMVYALVISILPGALTVSRHHFLRLLAMPFILLIFTVPALSFLIGDAADASGAENSKNSAISRNRRNLVRGKLVRLTILVLLITLTGVQAIYFQMQFRKWEPERLVEFHKDYPEVFEKALEQPLRPIYLKDGRYGPAYILALWYATVRGIDPANFVHLLEDEPIPSDSLVLSSDQVCTNCKVIMQKSVYILYRTLRSPDGETGLSNARIIGKNGDKPGEFSRPRGLAVDADGNIYVADTGNHRVQKFDSDGAFITSFGKFGTGIGELHSPNGIAVDDKRNIYITDAANNKLVRFGPDGGYQNEWGGRELGLYGPRDIAISPDGKVYIVDQGRSRITRFDPVTESFDSFGSPGKGEGEFGEPMGIAIGDGLVFVTESGNSRIQVFDLEGNYVRQWPVDVWEKGIDSYPDCVFDPQSGRLYVTSGLTKDVIVFDKNGNRIEGDEPNGNVKLSRPAAICLSASNNTKTLLLLDITDAKVAAIPLSSAK
jgi:DNA-binding beta-propeller fold protein YncE